MKCEGLKLQEFSEWLTSPSTNYRLKVNDCEGKLTARWRKSQHRSKISPYLLLFSVKEPPRSDFAGNMKRLGGGLADAAKAMRDEVKMSLRSIQHPLAPQWHLPKRIYQLYRNQR